MTIEQILVFNVTLLVAILSPGPAFLVAAHTTLHSGRRAGVATGLGLASVAALWTLMALLGLGAVFALVPWAYWAGKILGGLYLIYIAVCMWRKSAGKQAASPKTAHSAFKTGVLVNLINPKSVLFAAAVLIVIFPQHITPIERAFIVANHFVFEVVFYTLLAFIFSHHRVRTTYSGAKIYLDRVASMVLGALGIRLLLEK